MPACVWQPATRRSQALSADLQQIPSLNKQGKLHNNKDPFSSLAYFQAIAGEVSLTPSFPETFAMCIMQRGGSTARLYLFATLSNEEPDRPGDAFDADM